MSDRDVLMVRVYLTEGEGRLQDIMRYLHEQHRVAGATVYRGVRGFGASGHEHTSSLLDMSLDLPVVIEFFDAPERARPVIEHLKSVVDEGHVVFCLRKWLSWAGQADPPLTVEGAVPCAPLSRERENNRWQSVSHSTTAPSTVSTAPWRWRPT